MKSSRLGEQEVLKRRVKGMGFSPYVQCGNEVCGL